MKRSPCPALAARPAATATELADNLAQMYSAIYNVSLDRYDVSALARSAPQLINTLFEHRLRLREQGIELRLLDPEPGGWRASNRNGSRRRTRWRTSIARELGALPVTADP